MLQRTDNPKDGSNLGFDVKGVEAFMPLSPQHALYMPCSTTSNDRIARYDAAVELIEHKVVEALFGGHILWWPLRDPVGMDIKAEYAAVSVSKIPDEESRHPMLVFIGHS